MKVTSEELTAFVPIVESGNFSQTTEQLGQANSVISRAVRKLEMKLGVSLPNQTTQQLSPTERSERYFHRIQSILQEVAAAESGVMGTRDTPYGLLRIDAATPVVLRFLMPLIKPFREHYPEVTLSLVSSEMIIDSIERKADAAIRAGTLADSSLRAGPLFSSYRRIIAPPDYISRYGKLKTINDLKQHTCLGSAEPVSLDTWSIARSGGQLHEVKYGLSSSSGETLKQLCLSGNGIACLSDYMIDKETAHGELVELVADKMLPVEMPFSTVYYSNRAVSTRTRASIDFPSGHVETAPGETVREA